VVSTAVLDIGVNRSISTPENRSLIVESINNDGAFVIVINNFNRKTSKEETIWEIICSWKDNI
jgi:hypothetical protein